MISRLHAVVAPAAFLLLAAGVAACGGSSPTAATTPANPTVTVTVTHPSPAATGTSASTTTTGGTPTGTQTGPPTGTATTAGPACTAADLHPRFIGANGATGNVILDFALTNLGAGPCHTYGWPGVAFVTAAGGTIPLTPRRTTEDLLGSTPATALTLAPGQQVSFRIVAADTNSAGGTAGCHRAAGVDIIAPDDTASMHVLTGAGVTVCGNVSVSPLLPGTGAAPGV